MPVFEITDGAGRTLELEGDHEPTAQELEGIFKEAFPQEKIQPMTQAQADAVASKKTQAWGQPTPPDYGKAARDLAELTPEARAEMATPLVHLPNLSPINLGLMAAEKLGVPGAETAGKVYRGVMKPAQSMAEGLTSPIGIAMAPAFVGAPELMGPLMATQAASEGVPAAAQKMGEASVTGDVGQMAEGVSELGLNALMMAGGPAGLFTRIAQEAPTVLPGATETFQQIIPESRRLPSPRMRMPEFQEGQIGPEPRTVAPESRQLPAPRTRMPEFTESTLEPEGAPKRALPAPGESEATAGVLPRSPEAVPQAGHRIELPVEPEAAKIARQRWSEPIDVEAEVTAVDALKELVTISEEQNRPGQPYKPPTVSTDLRQLEAMIKNNTVSKVESWADEVLHNRMHTIADPEFLAALTVKGAILFKKGITKYSEWDAAMRKHFGNGLNAELPVIFKQSQEYWEKKGAPNASEVSKTTEVHGDVLRDVEGGTPKEGLPINEGQQGIRSQTEGRIQEEVAPKTLPSEPAAEGGAAPAATKTETPAGKVEPAGGSLGVTPNPLLAKLVDAAVPRQQGTPPPLQLDTSTNFPDFSPIDVANKNFARAFGVGRVPVLGWLFDPNARIRLPFQESLGRYFSERFDVARAQASAVGEMIRGRIDKAFNIDQAGRLKGVEGPEGKDPFWVDAFEAEEARPGSYNFSPEQRAALQVWLDLKKEAEPLMEKYKLTREMDDEAMAFDDMLALEPQKGESKKGYAPRIVRERPAQTARVGMGGVGSKASFEKPRLFPTMREGFEKGVRYEPSPEASIATWSERLYKRIADKRLAEDPNLGAVPVAEKRAELREYYADKVASGEWTPERLDQTVESVISQGRVDQPAFAGKFLDPEIAVAVNKAFPKGQHFMWRELANTTSFLKGLKFGFDWGAPMIQGLPTFLRAFTSPRDAKAWANGVAGMIKAQFSPEALPLYVKNNIQPIRELAAYGSSVGRLNEMVSGIGEGAPTTKAIEAAGRRLTDAGKPIVGKPVEWAAQGMEAFARSFGAFIDITKVELWKAYREITPREEWGDVIRGIESQLITSRMEGIGISRGQALVERVGLTAASYVRGSVNLIGGALTQPGVSGSMMRKAMGSMMITAPILFYGIGRAIRMRDDELKDRLDPRSSEFMMWRIPVGERNVNVGLGGIFKSYARLAGNVVKQAEENPKMMHMPFMRWYEGHAGPLMSGGWQGFRGRDFMGNEVTLPEVIGKAVLPVWLETVVSANKKENENALADAAFGLAGLNAFPQSLGRQFIEERETMARTQFKKPYEKLPVGDQFRINVELRRKALFEERTEQTLPQKEAQARKELMRQKIINKQLPQEVQDRLEVLGVVLPAYEPSLRIGNQTMTFTKAQESAYQNLIVDEYTKNLPDILKNPKLDTATPKQRQEVIGALAAKMRESAKLRLLQAINLEADKER